MKIFWIDFEWEVKVNPLKEIKGFANTMQIANEYFEMFSKIAFNEIKVNFAQRNLFLIKN